MQLSAQDPEQLSFPEKPNILFILADDLGYGDLSCQGATDLLTPNIDRIAEGGIRFTNFYANSTVCSPSRAALLSGRFPDLVGVPGVIRPWKNSSWGYLHPSAILLPELLKKAGYHTAIIGKWHLGEGSPNLPNERGFDHFHGWLADMMDDYYTHLRRDLNYMRLNGQEVHPRGHATDIFSDWAIEYIRERSKKDNPFFLYLSYNAPHNPIQPPETWLQKVKSREENIAEDRAGIVALIEHLDANIGRVIDALEQTGLIDNTIIIFASDNGGALNFAASNGPLRGGKVDMYEGGIKVPAGIYWKGRIEPGRICDRIIMLMDLYPTACELAGIEPEHPIDGISIVDILQGKDQDTDDRYLFWVRREGGFEHHAARYKNHKLVQNSPYEPIQYFDLENDPGELTDLAPQRKPEHRELRARLLEHKQNAGAIPWQNARSE
jgi:arylsulfatase A-like enzyme